MKRLIIDRIEEGFAVCEQEDLSHIAVPVSNFPFEVKEGTVVILNGDGSYSRDEAFENEKRMKILMLQKKLMNKNGE